VSYGARKTFDEGCISLVFPPPTPLSTRMYILPVPNDEAIYKLSYEEEI
jgi:hypothetical protein